MPQDPQGSGNQQERPYWSQVLRALREARGVTQDGWAAELGIGRTTLQRWENGQAVPDAQAEEGLVSLCAERGLFRRYESGPLRGITLTPEALRAVLAEARLGASQRPVSQAAGDSGGGSATDAQAPEPPPGTGTEARPALAAERTSSTRLYSLAIVAVVVGFVAVAAYVLSRGGGEDAEGTAAPSTQASVSTPAEVAAARPDGFISFKVDREGGPVVFVVNFDGSGLAMVLDDPLFDSDPKWSPDGRRIAFTSRSNGTRNIYLTSLDGGPPVQLTNHPAEDLEPAWSPDGSLIAFTSSREGAKDIYLMTPTGAIRERLTDSPADDFHPAWSPDGQRIAFASTRDGNREIYLMDADGSNLVRLTDHPADDDQPVWSPNGEEIAFQSRRDGNREIYAVNVDGTGLRRLTNHPEDDRQPAWSPDGAHLVFTSNRDGNRDIYIVREDGTGLRRLTESAIDKDQPTWVLPRSP